MPGEPKAPLATPASSNGAQRRRSRVRVWPTGRARPRESLRLIALLSPPAEPWRRNIYALRLTGFIAYFGFVFATPLLPLYLSELLGPGGDVELWVGLTFGISP